MFITASRCDYTPGRMEAILRLLKEAYAPSYLLAVKEDHEATNGEEAGVHWHVLIGTSSDRRIRWCLEDIVKMFGRTVNLRPVSTQGRPFNVALADTVQYMLKQVMHAMNMPENLGKKLLCSQFEAHRGDRYVGNWCKLWDMSVIGNIELKTADPKKQESHERFAKIFQMLMANGGNWAKTQEQLTLAPDRYFMFMNKQKLEAAAGAMLSEKQRNVESRTFEFPELKDYKMIVSPGDLHDKNIHLYLWGDANTGKTSLIERICQDNHIEYCKCIPGTEKLPENATSAEVILVDDAIADSKIPWSTILGWANGTYMTGVYKTPAASKRKVVIVTSNYDPLIVWPNMFVPAFNARFTGIRVTNQEGFPNNIFVDYLARTAPDEVKDTDIKWRELKGLNKQKKKDDDIEELSEGELVIPETPRRTTTTSLSTPFVIPGCESQSSQLGQVEYMKRKANLPVIDLQKAIEIVIWRKAIRTEFTMDVAVRETMEPSNETIQEAKFNMKNDKFDMDDWFSYSRMFNTMLADDNAERRKVNENGYYSDEF